MVLAPAFPYLYPNTVAEVESVKRILIPKRQNKMAIVTLQEVHKTYPLGKTEVHAIKGVSFEIGEGDFNFIAGPPSRIRSLSDPILWIPKGITDLRIIQ